MNRLFQLETYKLQMEREHEQELEVVDRLIARSRMRIPKIICVFDQDFADWQKRFACPTEMNLVR